MEKRIISTQITEEDYGIENSLRPLSLDDYVGQNKVKSNLKVYIEAAKEIKELKSEITKYQKNIVKLETELNDSKK